MQILWLILIDLVASFRVNYRNTFTNRFKCSTSSDNYPFSDTPTPVRTLDINEDLKNRLIDSGYNNLTLIQEKSISRIIDNDFNNIFIHSETGSGKTLCYAIPLVHLYRTKYNSNYDENVQNPIMLVIVPSKLLEIQVLNVFHQILDGPECELAKNLGKSRTLPPIVIGTIDSISRIFRIFTDNFKFDPLQSVKIAVYDEVDFLVQQHNSKILSGFIKKIPNARSILCGASINDAGKYSIMRLLNRLWKKIEWIKSDFVHRLPPTIAMDFHEIKHTLNSKIGKLVELCGETQGPKMIFCQSRSTALWLYDNLPLANKYLLSELKLDEINSLESNRIIISTDHRGFDSHFVHVIHFDFPQDILQLIHRSGRTGRAGKRGRVSFLVTDRSIDFYNEIRPSLDLGERLDKFFSRKRSLAKRIKKEKVSAKRDSLSNIT